MTTFVLVFSYLLGAIPNGLIFGKLLWKKDLRKIGSKNIGATNAWRTIGKPAGVLIFLLDFLKGAISVLLAKMFVGTPLVIMLAGIFAIIGHSFTIYLMFHGGKGVATGLGVISMMMPKVAIFSFLVWLAIVLVTRYVSFGSCVAAAMVPILAFAFRLDTEYVCFGLIIGLFVIYRHKENIRRLVLGTEHKI